MSRYFGYVLIAGAVLASGGLAAQEGPFQPLRRVFAPAVQTLKQTLEGNRPAAHAATAAPVTKAPDPTVAKAPDTPQTPDGTAPDGAETSPVTAGNVPDPHVRPDLSQPGEPTGGDQGDQGDQGALVANTEPASFDRRFEPEVAPETGITSVDVPLPRLRSDAPPPPKGTTQLASLPPGGNLLNGSACTRSLQGLGVVSVSVEPVRQGTCGISTPTEVSALGSGAISLSEKAVVNCQLAETLATWMRDKVNPAARQYLGGNVDGIRVAASYSCRTRDNIPGAKMSEHAYGNAIDISAFEVSGTGWVEVGHSKGIAAGRFLSAIRKSACGPFTTVLGPGTDSYHRDHFHLDLARRGKSGHSLYCK